MLFRQTCLRRTAMRAFSDLANLPVSNGKIINGVTKSGVVDDFRSVDNTFDDDDISHRQADSTGRARTYFMLAAPKFAMASMARITAFKFLSTWAPSADVLALGTSEVDISKLGSGDIMTAKWRGKAVFVANRSEEQLQASIAADELDLRDKQTTMSRCKPENPKLMVSIGVCTHLGCVPVTKAGAYDGGYFCPCHGSHYDQAARIRKGPAPLNLEIPPWKILPGGKAILVG